MVSILRISFNKRLAKEIDYDSEDSFHKVLV